MCRRIEAKLWVIIKNNSVYIASVCEMTRGITLIWSAVKLYLKITRDKAYLSIVFKYINVSTNLLCDTILSPNPRERRIDSGAEYTLKSAFFPSARRIFQLNFYPCTSYEDVSKSFRTGCLEWELQMTKLSPTRCSCIAISWVSLVSFAAITLCIASQRVFIIIVIVYFFMDSVRKLLDTPSYSWPRH